MAIEFDEELKKFQPSLEVGDVEEVIKNQDLTDVIDLLRDAETRRIEKEVRGSQHS